MNPIYGIQALLARRPGLLAAADNFGWLVADKAVRLLFGALVGFLVARYLGPEQFGTLSYALALTGILLVVVEGGMEAVVKRDILRRPEAAGTTLMAAAALRFVAAIVSYGFLLGFVFTGMAEGAGDILLVCGGLFFQSILMLPDLWLHARLDARASVRAQLAALAAGSLARLSLILLDAPLIMFCWVSVGEGVLAGMLVAMRARRAGLRFDVTRRIGSVMRGLFRDTWPLMFAGLSVSIYMRVDAVMLRSMSGDGAVGVYAAATRLSEIWYFVPMAMASSVLPSLIRAKEGDACAYKKRLQQYFDLSAGAAYMLSIPLALLSVPLIQGLYGVEYAAAAPILAVHIWASIFVFLGVARGQCLVNEGLTAFYAICTMAGAFINVALNMVLIPRFDGLGAAWATLISYGCAAWATSYCHSAVRPLARLQTKALLIPFRFWSYLRGK